MDDLIYFAIVFVLVLLVYTIFIVPRRLKKLSKVKSKKTKKNYLGEATYIIGKFKLDEEKINLKAIMYTLGIINSFIMAFVCMVVAVIPLDRMLQFLIGFVLLFLLIYSLYEIYGRILVKKGMGKSKK